jgi:hypothetical protein
MISVVDVTLEEWSKVAVTILQRSRVGGQLAVREMPEDLNRSSLVRHVTLTYAMPGQVYVFSTMRPRTLLIVLSGSIALCTPVPQPTRETEIQVEQSSILPGVKNGLIATFSLAGLLALVAGVTEYASRIHHRIKTNQIENQNVLQETNFNRSRNLIDDEFRFAGTDVVLDLVGKYVNGKSGEDDETDVDGEKPNETVLLTENKTTADEASVASSEDPPLPRLPGFPPLSGTAAR